MWIRWIHILHAAFSPPNYKSLFHTKIHFQRSNKTSWNGVRSEFEPLKKSLELMKWSQWLFLAKNKRKMWAVLGRKSVLKMSKRGIVGMSMKNKNKHWTFFQEEKQKAKIVFNIYDLYKCHRLEFSDSLLVTVRKSHVFGSIKWIIGSFNKFHAYDTLLDGQVKRDTCVEYAPACRISYPCCQMQWQSL